MTFSRLFSTHRGPARQWMLLRLCLGLCFSVLAAGCDGPRDNSRAAYILVDISRDYATELKKAQTLSNYLLANLTSGDSLAIAFTDNGSFTERNIIARAKFDHRPSVANQQKRVFQEQLRQFVEKFRVPSAHNDITGGVLLAKDYLEGTNAGKQYLFLLSDLHEDLPPWLDRDIAVHLEGIQVVAVNVKRQRSDNNNPRAYEQRVTRWQQRVEDGGGRWLLVNDLARLDTAVALR